MIHKFIFDDTRMVFDVHSGALHIVDELIWDLLEAYGALPEEELAQSLSGKYLEEDISEALEEIKELTDKNILFSPDPLGGAYKPPGESVVKALCLHLAHDCNLSCRYCFAGQGKFGGAPGLMTAEVGRKALEFLVNSSGERHHLEVDFFGGEPLLNFDVLRMLVDYGRSLGREKGKEIKFTVTTNAILLDGRIGDFLNKNDISVILSIDGRQGVHDAMRPFRDRKGSYDVVVKNIKSFLESRDYRDYYVRGTYTALNTDFSCDVEHLASLGFDNISLEPVVAGEKDHYSLRDSMFSQISSEYEKLTRSILKMTKEGRHINFFHFNIDFEGGPCLPKRMSGCGAGHQYLAVDPPGTLYPCHQFVGREEFVLGDVFTGVRRGDLTRLFRNSHLYRKEGCGQCWAKFHCSGGCHANAVIHNGSIEKPYSPGCLLAKKRLECAMYLAQWKNAPDKS
ncbi:MAG: radical SAM protein [Peptococcaceae bacterium BRH_c4a]|nr:MAG: radical SAM protein [Peptococcaceae bacterium BRH_c4a]